MSGHDSSDFLFKLFRPAGKRQNLKVKSGQRNGLSDLGSKDEG